MKVFFVVFHTSLSRARLWAARRKLGKLLAGGPMELRPLAVGEDVRAAITRLVLESMSHVNDLRTMGGMMQHSARTSRFVNGRLFEYDRKVTAFWNAVESVHGTSR